MRLHFVWILLCSVSLFSCVSSKKFKAEQTRYETLNGTYQQLQKSLKDCEEISSEGAKRRTAMLAEMEKLHQEIEFLKKNNNQAFKQLEDLSIISSTQAESIRKSMENIGAKDSYIQDLQSSIARKDSLNLALVMNLKGAIGNMDDQDINIKVDKGVVYIDISDKLLFKSGSYEVADKAKTVLGKVATVLKNQPDIEFMVEGHTDNVPYRGNGLIKDNWDLSVLRATSVVRLLEKQYGLESSKMAAAGRSEFKPIGDNTVAEGKASNRRTRIVILPQLDQFFKLLETKK